MVRSPRVLLKSQDLGADVDGVNLSDFSESRRDRRPHLDSGLSLVEILVAVVLIGVAGVATLGAMAATARGSAVNKSATSGVLWLQSAEDFLATAPFSACVVGNETQVGVDYLNQLASASAPPSSQGWAQSQLTLVQPVLFWNGSQFTTTCNTTYQIQQVTLKVKDPSSAFSSTIVMVKSKPSG